jgi:NADPH:quinone reductase-like Zn-dependent oxidoreductase
MKAVVFEKHGSPDVLEYKDVPEPKPGAHEVLVQVKAASINHLDIWVRKGIRGPAIPMPHISGCDGAGVVAEVGSEVSGLAVKQPVIIAPGISCGNCRYCTSGWDSLCPAYQIIGYQRQGTFAEYVVVPKENVVPLPEWLSYPEAASIPLVFLTAYHMLFTRGSLKMGEDVLVMAAGSGVGSSAIQLAKLAGARVIAAAGSPAKLDLARKLGADDAIDYRQEDLRDRIKDLTSGKGVDLVVEHTGGDYLKQCIHALSRNGRIITCGATAEPVVDIDLRLLFVKHVNLLGSYMGARWEFMEILKLFRAKKLKPVVDSVFSFKEAAKAQAYIEQRKNLGKVVLVP